MPGQRPDRPHGGPQPELLPQRHRGRQPTGDAAGVEPRLQHHAVSPAGVEERLVELTAATLAHVPVDVDPAAAITACMTWQISGPIQSPGMSVTARAMGASTGGR